MDGLITPAQNEQPHKVWVGEEVQPLDLEMRSPSFIEETSSDVQSSKPTSTKMVNQERNRVQSRPVLGDHDRTVSRPLKLLDGPEVAECGCTDRTYRPLHSAYRPHLLRNSAQSD